jgi:hypothetical protein
MVDRYSNVPAAMATSQARALQQQALAALTEGMAAGEQQRRAYEMAIQRLFDLVVERLDEMGGMPTEPIENELVM